MSLTLVLGGTRSGKSRRGEELAAAAGRAVRYVATADEHDPSMRERIARHLARRPPAWETVSVGGSLGGALEGAQGRCLLVDGLGSWVAGALERAGAFANGAAAGAAHAEVRAELQALIRHAAAPEARVIVVAEQAGEGLLPTEPGARAWLDLLGEAVQQLAAAADHVELVVAGRVLAVEHALPDGPDRHHGDRDVGPGEADHAVNVLAGGPPDWLAEALGEALEGRAARYPDEGAAVAALAALHGRDRAEILPVNGAAEGLWLLPAALRPRLAVCVHPGFAEAEAALRAHGVAVARVLRDPARDFALDPSAVPDAADLVVVGHPASPSGTLDPAAALLALRRPGRVLVVDEAFMSLVPGEPGTLVGEALEDVVVVRSLTKVLSIPGLRAGYVVAAAPIAARIRAVRPPWSANVLALAALAAGARRPDALAERAARAEREREDLVARLAAIDGLRTWPSVTNFCLVEVGDGPAVLAALHAEGIAVRPAASFPGLGAGHLRLTARSPAENERLAGALRRALGAGG